jgi:hypothetical protein
VVARHERLNGEAQTRYDWQHYIPLLQRKRKRSANDILAPSMTAC